MNNEILVKLSNNLDYLKAVSARIGTEESRNIFENANREMSNLVAEDLNSHSDSTAEAIRLLRESAIRLLREAEDTDLPDVEREFLAVFPR